MNRPEQVEAEIAALPGPPGSTKCGSYLRRLLEDGASLRPETLVYIIREARIAKCSEQDHLACLLLTGLQVDGTVNGGHCEAVVRKAARKGGFVQDPERLHDFRQRVFGDMFRQIRAGREAQPIWEQEFFVPFKRRVLDVVDTFRTQVRRDAECDSLDAPGGSAVADPAPPVDEALFRAMAADQLYQLATALDGNPGRAFFLRHIEDRPVKGPGGVAEIMGVSDRTVRNYLEAGRVTLSRNPIVVAMRDDLRDDRRLC